MRVVKSNSLIVNDRLADRDFEKVVSLAPLPPLGCIETERIEVQADRFAGTAERTCRAIEQPSSPAIAAGETSVELFLRHLAPLIPERKYRRLPRKIRARLRAVVGDELVHAGKDFFY